MVDGGIVAETSIDSTAFRSLLRQVPAAVAVIAAGPVGERMGLTATAVCPLSDAPPTMLVCVNRSATAHDAIVRAGHFSVNMLALGQEDIGNRFAGRTGLRGEARFEGLAWTTLASGAPILTGALAVMDCELVEIKPVATHSVLIGRVLAGTMTPGASPLLYHDGDFLGLPSVV